MHLLSAACHGCLLIAETSCEQGNDWLEARPCSRRADHRCSRRGLLPVTDCPIPIIRELPERVLIDLVQALRAGHPTEAATAFMVRYAVPAVSEAAVLEMSSLLASGFGPKHAALLLDVIAAERMPHIVTSGLELVTSGPDVTGATCDTGVVLRELFSEAEHRVLVVGLMKFSRPSRIGMRHRADLAVRLCLDIRRALGDATTSEPLLRRFAERFVRQEWPGPRLPDLFYDPEASLKAKGREPAFTQSASSPMA
jgi:hypothetical protein